MDALPSLSPPLVSHFLRRQGEDEEEGGGGGEGERQALLCVHLSSSPSSWLGHQDALDYEEGRGDEEEGRKETGMLQENLPLSSGLRFSATSASFSSPLAPPPPSADRKGGVEKVDRPRSSATHKVHQGKEEKLGERKRKGERILMDGKCRFAGFIKPFSLSLFLRNEQWPRKEEEEEVEYFLVAAKKKKNHNVFGRGKPPPCKKGGGGGSRHNGIQFPFVLSSAPWSASPSLSLSFSPLVRCGKDWDARRRRLLWNMLWRWRQQHGISVFRPQHSLSLYSAQNGRRFQGRHVRPGGDDDGRRPCCTLYMYSSGSLCTV